jgi:uncharacterized membrane protein YdbT with pleckstrin-like domain
MKDYSNFHVIKDLHSTERIIKVIHRNWFYVFQQFFLIIMFSVIIFSSIMVGLTLFPDFFTGENKTILFFLQSFFMLSIWIFSFLIWIDYYFDIWIITSERIINIEQIGMFTRRASELRFQKIQDVTVEVLGFLPTIFNFGDVKIQTAGTENEFIFRTVSDPQEIKNIIMKILKHNEEGAKEEIQDMIDKIKG